MWSEDLLQSVHSLKWEKRVKYVGYGGDGVIVYRYMFYISTYIYICLDTALCLLGLIVWSFLRLIGCLIFAGRIV